ncbi:hypothetical protein F5Y00DRAFT_264839 [Daldinia vernicosa]|uniref:uncharacterized protein n=1 Tax=Daldinia vernicosa TaxID=114800 RepID=UPI002007C234|nr:uncharacterized protein F5Y00DRAFT_264839 [Daldinia vernicosa]KAI0846122.1 hypothetical protein F5Y00DRAFT_264839 [Daldinia vernicosa]
MATIRWARSPTMDRLLLNYGWCRGELPNLYFKCSPVVLLYHATLERTRPDKDHSRCTDVACCDNQIEDGTYKPSHDENCRSMECGMITAPVQAICEVLLYGGIPIVRVVEGPYEPIIELDSFNLGEPGTVPPYVAISHVWSDDACECSKPNFGRGEPFLDGYAVRAARNWCKKSSNFTNGKDGEAIGTRGFGLIRKLSLREIADFSYFQGQGGEEEELRIMAIEAAESLCLKAELCQRFSSLIEKLGDGYINTRVDPRIEGMLNSPRDPVFSYGLSILGPLRGIFFRYTMDRDKDMNPTEIP